MSIRVRIAPAPSGDLQLGNIRTALANYAYAFQNNGKFILRIDDTNQNDTNEKNIDSIVKMFDWLGFKFDEGPCFGGDYGPYMQSKRTQIYESYLENLSKKGLIYNCFCKTGEDCSCMNSTSNKGENPAIRAKLNQAENIIFDDLLKGRQEIKKEIIKDPIIKRQNGQFTYVFANSVDDIEMRITDVIRGEDLLPSTGQQILLINAMGSREPRYAHLPLILDQNGNKLSKRVKSQSINNLKEEGYLAEAILLYVGSLGLPKYENIAKAGIQELLKIMNIRKFDLASPKYDPERLIWFNKKQIAKLSNEELYNISIPHLENNKFNISPRCIPIMGLVRETMKKLSEIKEAAAPYLPRTNHKFDYNFTFEAINMLNSSESKQIINLFYQKINNAEEFNNDRINAMLGETRNELGLNDREKGKIFYFSIRSALIGDVKGPELDRICIALGKEETIKRLVNYS